jgi:CheY-like chemotaxis protein
MRFVDDVLIGLAAFAWPVLIGLILWQLWPSIRKIIDSRGFTVKYGGMELSVQDASDQLRKQVEDLQNHVLSLKKSPAASGMARTMRSGATSERTKTILWVDDEPRNNAHEISKLEDDGYRVIRANSTVEARSILGSGTELAAIVTDMGREEDGKYVADAGLELIWTMREESVEAPIFVYTNPRRVRQIHADVLEAGGNGTTASPVELFAAIEGDT